MDICHWKCSELKTFFFYYALPVLAGLMQEDVFENFKCLVAAIALLNSDTVTNDMVQEAERLLHIFVSRFEHLYGQEFCTLNVHQLLHLPACVRDLGNLWVFSCFPYEDLNGKG